MSKIDIYKEMLTAKSSYWVVARETSYTEYMETKRGEDNIIFVAIPSDTKVYENVEDIMLVDIEKLERAEMVWNIFLNTNYPPFQQGITFYDVYDGFPIKENARKFLVEALQLNSGSLYDYEKLYKSLNQKEEQDGK